MSYIVNKFIFVDSFDIKWNGQTARFNTGISGSHSALLYLAEGLAKIQNNEVIITSTVNNIIEGNYNNVEYKNMKNLIKTDYDYIIVSNVLTCLDILTKVSNYKKIIILTHNDLNKTEKLLNINKDKIIIAFISEFAKVNIIMVQPFLNDYQHILLYNSIDSDVINCAEKDERSLCYFACIERGFKMVLKILEKLDGFKLNVCSYNTRAYKRKYKIKNINILNNNSKQNVLLYTAKSKYFIYPLINLDNNMIHYDTFGYVVLEALLNKTIVIAPKIKVYEELYGDAVCYIDTDDIIPQEDLLYWKKENSNFGLPLLDRYVEKIKLLETDEALYNQYIEKGLMLKDKFCNIKISNQLMEYLNGHI